MSVRPFEVHSIGKVTQRRLSPRIMEPLSTLVEEVRVVTAELKKSGEPALEGDALRRFVNADMRFHMLLLQAGGNQRMLKMLDSTSVLLQIFSLRRKHHTVRLLTEVHSFHRRILDAVAKGSKTEAMELLSEHIQVSLEERLAEFEDPR